MIEGEELLELMPDFATPPKIVVSRRASQVNFAPAEQVRAFHTQAAIHAFSHKHVMVTRAQRTALEAFFDDHCGRWKGFWVPSWHCELVPTAGVGTGETELSIEPVRYATAYDPTATDVRQLGHYIFMLHRDGTLHTTKVESVAGTDPEVLTLTTGPAQDFNLGEFMVGFLYHVRFVSDELGVQFSGPDIATATIGMVESIGAESEADEP